ncbi:hypothetical protein BASA50_004035 [Batrachochytrium salamandrivorans]|uniref:Uncharacterized protein n=1 Tax=Batrachochytrium salamandrivorans TaxID=1357716 RepID=A0ABQ8FH21_9FUNG|nr:hypothetical protein BASA62_002907 [Batrachochytrium salamandrivorans]KAH6581747.1 hypothetical protein BASA60_002240 [Batrachochytrium salamandrivorans]KAH6598154.1 hypothetical protein BASA50_004035 [Batrachochytrium salamandrivorans]KAH6601919.1 hypothetical protein BASA61_001622 [Batrachochytrium salamandrivorans]KAJ1340764.1 hypothetical protein BSLG_004858 [Batrachochytrium salamandrivorans]
MSVPDPSGSMSMLDMDMNMAMQHSDHPLAALVSAAAAAAAAAAVSTAEDSGDMDAMDTGGIDAMDTQPMPFTAYTSGTATQAHVTDAGIRSTNESAIPCDFIASLRSVAPFVTILRAISFKQKAYCTIAAEGMRLTAEDSRTVQAKAYLPKSLFREFKLSDNTTLDPDEELSFMVDIRMLTDCLSIFGAQQQPGSSSTNGDDYMQQPQHTSYATQQSSPVSLQLSYPRNGGELTLMLKDGNVVTACSLATYDNEPITDLHMSFGDRRTVGKIIMKSDWLKTAFAELDSTSSDLTLAISPQHPFFRISASGLAGESQLDYPRDTEVLESFNCTMATVNKYKFTMLHPCMKALGISAKTSIRVNEIGILSMQFMIQLTTSQISFVDYIVLPIEENN